MFMLKFSGHFAPIYEAYLRFFLLIAALITPVQALALSCAPWHVENAYQRAAESGERYVVVNGTLTFNEDALPKVDFDRQEDTPRETHIDAVLTGNSMSLTGFNRKFKRTVSLVIKCFGPWCSTASTDTPTLAFLKRGEDAFELVADPCSAMLFQNPEKDHIRRVLNCFSGGKCAAPSR